MLGSCPSHSTGQSQPRAARSGLRRPTAQYLWIAHEDSRIWPIVACCGTDIGCQTGRSRFEKFVRSTLLIRLSHALNIDTQLRALLVKVTALQPQRPSCLRHTVMPTPQFGQDSFALERLCSCG